MSLCSGGVDHCGRSRAILMTSSRSATRNKRTCVSMGISMERGQLVSQRKWSRRRCRNPQLELTLPETEWQVEGSGSHSVRERHTHIHTHKLSVFLSLARACVRVRNDIYIYIYMGKERVDSAAYEHCIHVYFPHCLIGCDPCERGIVVLCVCDAD